MAIIADLQQLILDNLGLTPTSEQRNAAEAMSRFMLGTNADSIYVLRGYAGTGKTSLIGALVRTLHQLGRRVVLMAPTGRAAQVFAAHAGYPAYTIHKRIYRQKAFNGEMIDFMQGVNLLKNVLFIVDEASMISNLGGGGQAVFGTGRLLDDLIQFVYSSEGCRLMLVGDDAQLPPVGEAFSPALSASKLGSYGFDVTESRLTQVVRQLDSSGILYNATMLRRMLTEDALGSFPQFHLHGFADIRTVSGEELIEALERSYSNAGVEQTIVISRSNKRATAFNQGIRSRILGMEGELEGGERLMVVKNNYHWLAEMNQPAGDDTAASGSQAASDNQDDFIANGDMLTLQRFRNERTVHGFRFADVTLRMSDDEHTVIQATMLMDALHTDAPALTAAQQQQLFQAVWDDYPEIRNKRDRMKAVQKDQFYNALQVKYAYAVTCHKAQGGQWEDVYIDQGYVTEDMLDADYLRWLYTALTRSTQNVYLVNWPKQMLDSESLAEIANW